MTEFSLSPNDLIELRSAIADRLGFVRSVRIAAEAAAAPRLERREKSLRALLDKLVGMEEALTSGQEVTDFGFGAHGQGESTPMSGQSCDL